VARLPEHERLVVVLRYLNGHSVAEVAAALGRPVGTVTKQLSRAIERLKVRAKGVIG
jgi:RNA polymerase sigma-70 factor (ECF subfamily)